MSVGKLSDTIRDMQKEYGKSLKWQQVKDLLTEQLGLYDAVPVSEDDDKALQDCFRNMMKSKNSDKKTLYASLSAISDMAMGLLDKYAKLGWTTGSHSAAAVPIFAVGVGAERFSGWHDNGEIMPLILKAVAE